MIMISEPRALPQSVEAETAILGGILLNPSEVIDQCIAAITVDHFHVRSHQIIYSAICDMVSQGKPVDPMTVTAHLNGLGKLDEVGGAYFLSQLTIATPTSAHTEYYLDILRQKHQLRCLIDIGDDIHQSAYVHTNPVELISKAEADLFHLATRTVADINEVHQASLEIDDKIARRLRGERVTGIPSGIKAFDLPTAGYRKCLNYVFAGPPGGGKTAWAEQSCVNATLRGVGALFVSLEMSADRVLERMACRAAQVPYWRFINNTMKEADLLKFQQTKNLIAKSPIHILCPNDLTGPALRSIIRRYKRKHDIQLVVVDYVQRMKSTTQREPRLIIAEASSCFVDAVKESKVAGILISQMNREHAKETRPRMSHLAESSQIEKDADFIGFLWPEVARETVGLGEPYPFILTIEKNRDGPSGNDQKVYFDGSTLSFRDRDDNLVRNYHQ